MWVFLSLFVCLAVAHGMRDLSSLTRYWTCICCSGSRLLITGLPGKSLLSLSCSDFSSVYHTPSFSGLSSLSFCTPTLSWRSSCHSACSFSALPLAPLPLLTSPVLVCPRALAIVFLQVISSYPMGFISHLYAVYTPAYITSRFPVPDRPKTELWLPPLPAPNLFLP